MANKIRYSEPDDFFPKEIREKLFSDEKEGKKEILKKLKDPKTSQSEKVELMEKLYDGIEFKEKNALAENSNVELVLQKQRNGEELTDDELDILFEQMSTETAESMNGTHPKNK